MFGIAQYLTIEKICFCRKLCNHHLTFGFLFEHILDVSEGSLGLTHWIHTVNIVPMKRLIENYYRNVADTAKVHEILDGKRIPNLYGMSDNYMRKGIRN